MGKHLSKYQSEADYNNNKDTHVKPHISYIVNPTKKMVYLQKTYIERYFTIEVFEDGTVGIDIPNSANSIKYRVNANKWVETSEAIQLSVSTNDKIQISCVCTKFENENDESLFNISTPFKVYGNVMSLLFGDDFEGKTDLTGHDHAFYSLFCDCRTLIYASNLILPATTLASGCYNIMFCGCTSLTVAPALPATTLASGCYDSMFRDCTSLTTAPELPATTLAKSCYASMFQDCTSLTEAPELQATTLAEHCYSDMFYGCTSLVSAPELPAETLMGSCYSYMFNSCNNLTTAPTLPATTLKEYCYTGMFQDCTSLVSAPELPATTLAYRCYSAMFYNCRSLTSAPALPATTLAEECYKFMFSGTNVLPDCSNIDFSNEEVVTSCGLNGLFAGTKVTDADLERILPKNSEGKYCLPATTLAEKCYNCMFYGCTSLVTAPELPATALAYGCYDNIFNGCTSLTVAPALPATTLAEECYNCMFQDCSSLTEAPALPATTLADSCYSNMFRDCTSLTEAPELYAVTLASYCYSNMFRGCNKLNKITMLATDISAKRCLYNWVNGIASNGTFVKHPNMNSLSTGTSGIPSRWTVEDYVLETNLITFYIGNVEYQYKEGMTWEEWINSEYNIDNFIILLRQIHVNDGSLSSLYVNGTSIFVIATDYIDAKNTYKFIDGGSGD